MEKKHCPFGHVFREQRVIQGISLWNLALAIPYRQGNIQRIERGLHEPRLGLAMRMLSAIGVDAGLVLEELARAEGLLPGKEEPAGETGPKPFHARMSDSEKSGDTEVHPFGGLLRECRLEHGKSQKLVAESAGYTLRNLINVEKGTQEPGVMLALRLVIASGGDPKIFFGSLQRVMRTSAL